MKENEMIAQTEYTINLLQKRLKEIKSKTEKLLFDKENLQKGIDSEINYLWIFLMLPWFIVLSSWESRLN